MNTQATIFSLVYGLVTTHPIEFKVESVRAVVESRFTESRSLRNRLITLEALDESLRMNNQHIEAIQRQRKMTFDK